MQNANKAARQAFDTVFGFLHPGRANQISINSANNANTGALITGNNNKPAAEAASALSTYPARTLSHKVLEKYP